MLKPDDATSYSSAAAATGPDALNETVLSVIAEVTRYPRTILLPDSDLEEDLGIDSVKRAEIISILRARLELPETDNAAPEQLRTIGDVIKVIGAYKTGPTAVRGVTAAPAVVPEPPPEPGPFGLAATPASHLDSALLDKVIDIIAEVTRYPKDLLQPGASLEEDLGFDPAQQNNIFAAIREKLGMPERAQAPATETIGDMLSAVQRSLAPAPAPAPVMAEMPRSGEHPSTVDAPFYSVSPEPFAGKIALVTGSGHGLGKVIARELAARGATVVVNSFHSRQRGEETVAEILAGGGKAIHLWGSVANPAHLEQIFREIDSQLGKLDFFISNASNGVLARLKDVQPEHMERAFRTSVVALHQGSLLAAELMRRRGGGKIVAISSNGSQRYLDYFGCMGPVKAAVECLVRYLAVELGRDNIQVNAVAAGPIYGELLDKYPDRDKLLPRWEAVVPRRSLNDEKEVADAVMFLLTTSGMNGSVLLLDAGGGQRISVPLN